MLGNKSEVLTPVDVTIPLLLIGDLGAVPTLFSPNGDTRREQVALRLALQQELRLDARVVRADGTPVRTLEQDVLHPAGAAVLVWDGRLDNGGIAPDGVYRVEFVARLASNPGVTQEEALRVELDATPPLIEVERPVDGGFTTSVAGVFGSATDANFAGLVLDWTNQPTAPSWARLSEFPVEVQNGTLAALGALEEGSYAVRLVATDRAENETVRVVTFGLDNTPPEVALTAPEAGTWLSKFAGPSTVLGQIVEENLRQARVEIGAGETPSSWQAVQVLDCVAGARWRQFTA